MVRLSRISQIAIRGDDLDQARSFYEDLLGAAFIACYDPPGLLFFNFEGTRLLIERSAPISVVYFWVDDIDESYRQLIARRVRFESEPHMIHADVTGVFGLSGEEEWMAFFKDPSGNTLALASRKPVTIN